jgi:hypothetical protein
MSPNPAGPHAIDPAPAVAAPPAGIQRFLIVRTFPPGALDGLDAATKQKVNTGNAQHGARWLHSYANGARTRTFCLYEGPDESSVVAAAKTNGLPIDEVIAVPVVLLPR